MTVQDEKRKKEGVRRREIVTRGGAVAAALAGGLIWPTVAAPGRSAEAGFGRRLAMVIDLRRCIGCKACAVACKAENGVRLGGFRSWVSEKETGTYPRVTRHFLPRLCNQCGSPACLKVCPTGATWKRDDGLVEIDRAKCIGCRHCMNACPYSVRYFNPDPDPEGERLFPSRTRGTVDKCNFCAHRVDNGVVPSCVNTCPTGARIFGDLNDVAGEVHRLVSGGTASTLLSEFGTGPSVFYIGGETSAFREQGRTT
jgi:tetrathionate reductase subunit B